MSIYCQPTKFCKDCEFYRLMVEHTKKTETEHRMCVWSLDLVTGVAVPRPAEKMRASSAAADCGPDGRFWERRKVKQITDETTVRHRK